MQLHHHALQRRSAGVDLEQMQFTASVGPEELRSDTEGEGIADLSAAP